MKQKGMSLFLAILMCFTLTLSEVNGATLTITSNQSGTHDGYNYELWKDKGTTSMTLDSGGTFSCEWNEINNVLFRKGKKFNMTKTHEQLGNITMTYGCDYQPVGNSYLCVYGWTTGPLIEYYIVDSWGTWRPPGAKSKGTITVDEGTYDIYETTRINQPSIQGTKTFQQYWSVRTTKRESGTISVSEHFKEWEKMGMKMGNMYEVALTIEGYQSSGSANVYSNTLTIEEGVDTTPTSSPTQTPSEATPSQTPEPTPKNLTPTSTPIPTPQIDTTPTPTPISTVRSYVVSYQLNGGTNHKSNPKSYQSAKSYQLQKPIRKGYVFEGWYLDVDYKNKVDTIDEKTTGDIRLYAKWKKVTVSRISIKNISQKQNKIKLDLRTGDEGKDGYEFEYSTKKAFLKTQKNILKTRKSNVTIKKLLRGKVYYFRVRAYEVDSTKNKIFGKWSVVKKIKIKG